MNTKVFYSYSNPSAPYAVKTSTMLVHFKSMASACKFAEQLECDKLEIERLNGVIDQYYTIRLLPA